MPVGLADEKELENMNDLVEQKLKKLHYFPPNFHVQPPHSIIAAHPLLAGIPKNAFRSEVRNTLHAPLLLEVSVQLPPIKLHHCEGLLARACPPPSS